MLPNLVLLFGLGCEIASISAALLIYTGAAAWTVVKVVFPP